jgi:uncharacterized protein YjbI with pentapeptide repeats
MATSRRMRPPTSIGRARYFLDGARNVRQGEQSLVDVAPCANLQSASFLGANLQRADLTSVDARGADFWSAKLQGAILDRGQLQGSFFLGTQMQGASLAGTHLEGSELTFANLQLANLAGAFLDAAVFHSSTLDLVDLSRASLRAPARRDTCCATCHRGGLHHAINWSCGRLGVHRVIDSPRRRTIKLS